MCHADTVDPDVPEVEQREVLVAVPSGEQLPASRYLPEADEAPEVVLLPDIYGRTAFYRALCARLAVAGYAVTLPDIFFRQGPLPEDTREAAFERHSRLDEVATLADSVATVRWARSQQREVVGLLGFCLGGTLALDLCADDPLTVAVCYYPFPLGVANPCVRHMPRPIDQVDRISNPVLAHWGDADYIPLHEIEDFGAAMVAAANPYQAHVYAGAGHGFLKGLVEPGPDADAAATSWKRSLDFFARHLAASG